MATPELFKIIIGYAEGDTNGKFKRDRGGKGRITRIKCPNCPAMLKPKFLDAHITWRHNPDTKI